MPEILTMLLHIDQYLGIWVEQYGAWIYVILFLIIFGETGLVILPFLPGDSLLFIAGAFGATGALNPFLLACLLFVGAVLGNTVNYHVGRYIGPKVFTTESRFLDRKALIKTQAFYAKYGGITIVLSRFLPVFRTFAPFVAGVGSMPVWLFQLYNVLGAALWIFGLITLGYFFGNVPIIKEHLSTIVLLGLAAAVVPVVLGVGWRFIKSRHK
ncbi:MAG TPA: VTT domain-containing protein [Paenalcaligenes hominis]|uniref:Membrane-associated protein n=2 Tax=Paenalcaligenes hominis TaxID=643674 RepID=A0A9D3AA15_9BURK|nr:VTT domain-containing protein [Paenalcaligenes hominis]NJB64692.1 membrane-associated protein [Paenalcaligenes hominis]GGE59833.1 hypothetical protein GCM10007278_04990 [Paenalcaligenes hominis]HJH22925.1 VTT domain-containing protein [Paenalcaligenes hominis]